MASRKQIAARSGRPPIYLASARARLLAALASLPPDHALDRAGFIRAIAIAEVFSISFRNAMIGEGLIEVVPDRSSDGSFFVRLTPRGRLMAGGAS